MKCLSMKFNIALIALIVLSSCSLRPKYRYVSHLDAQALGEGFVDSLMQIGVDSIVSYFDGRMGGIPGAHKTYWVYWEHQGSRQMMKFTNYERYHPKKFFFTNEFAFFDSLVPILKAETIDREFTYLDHFTYEEFQIVSPSHSYRYWITDASSKKYIGSASVLAIDKFKAMIYQTYDRYWPGYDYKKERLKQEVILE